jgi:hypothetical protein
MDFAVDDRDFEIGDSGVEEIDTGSDRILELQPHDTPHRPPLRSSHIDRIGHGTALRRLLGLRRGFDAKPVAQKATALRNPPLMRELV